VSDRERIFVRDYERIAIWLSQFSILSGFFKLILKVWMDGKNIEVNR